MDFSEAIANLCRVPVHHRTGTKSSLQLVKESGALEHVSVLAVSKIGEFIGHNSNLVDEWLNWSNNKRTSSGWYFTTENDGYVVGFSPNGETLHFDQPVTACSEFIIREFRSIAFSDSGQA